MTKRKVDVARKTKETEITVTLCLDGTGEAAVKNGLGFLDHMVATLAFHARFDLELTCKGDLHTDDHHTAEDCGLALGTALDRALGEERRIARFGSAHAPMDEALARAVVDLSGRPAAVVNLGLKRYTIGGVAGENLVHFIQSLATAARASLHVDVLRGENDHHRAEAAFKALAMALRQAVAADESRPAPSTKGVL